MRATLVTLALALAPAAVFAQEQQQGGGEQEKREPAVRANARSEARAEVVVEWARAKGLPERPLLDRIAEGRAKGASEAEIAAESNRLMARLETAHRAIVRAGREDPSEEEVTRGAQVLARGTTEAELEGLARKCPSDRSLVVAFDVLTRLEAQGLPVDRALAAITQKLEARAPDAEIRALVNASADVGIRTRKP